jgi:arylsulfatase A-like enzyme
MSDRLTRREFLGKGLQAAGVAGAVSALPVSRLIAEPATRKPNVVYVFADQLRYSALGCSGNRQIRTPNIDKMASRGVLFRNAISGFPLCSPYRAMLITGRYGQSTGMVGNDIYLPQTRNSIANVFARAGYQTGYIGKWHLEAHRQPYVPKERRQGFDYWVTENCTHQYFDGPTCFGDDPNPRPLPGYQPDAQTDLAINYIREHKDKPFFLCLSWSTPHNPHIAPPQWLGMYSPDGIKLPPNTPESSKQSIARYYAMTSNLDYNIGRLRRALVEAGIEEDTILVFSSDHGDMLGAHGQGTAPKQRPWEESIHVPFIVSYPRRVPRGRKIDTLLHPVDIMPTLLGLAGVATPSSVQGTDLSGFVLGKPGKEPDSVLLQIVCPAGGDNSPPAAWRGVRTKRYTYARFRDKGWVLYDNARDPYQLNNLIDKPEARTLQAEMEEKLQGWLKRTGDDFASEEEWRRRIGKPARKR